MEIKNARDLAKIADLCRKKGITEIKIGENCIELKIGDKPEKRPRLSSRASNKEQDKPLQESGPTEEELLFWSAGGISTDQKDEQGAN